MTMFVLFLYRLVMDSFPCNDDESDDCSEILQMIGTMLHGVLRETEKKETEVEATEAW